MPDSASISHVLIAFGAFQAFFLALILLTGERKNLPKKFFAVFLIIEGFTLIERLLVETDLILMVPYVLGISYPLSFIKPPVLFFMGLAIINPEFRLRKLHYLHFIPYLIFQLMNVPFYFQTAEFKLQTVAGFMSWVPTYDSFNFWLFSSFFINIGVYLIVTVRKLRIYQKEVKNNRLANFFLPVLNLYLLGLTLGFIYFLIRPLNIIEIPAFNLVSMLVMTFLIQTIAYGFLTRSSILTAQSPSLKVLDQMKKDENKIREKLEKEKVFLDDTLTLESFAYSLDLPKKYVSDLINQKFGYSYKEAVNRYRVEEARILMKETGSSEAGLIQIGLKAGFNNKVSFYRTFKKFTGKSPSEYANALKNSSHEKN